VTTLLHLATGVVWDFTSGPARSSEREHLRQMLAALPQQTLLIADAGFTGYDLLMAILRQRGRDHARVATTEEVQLAQRYNEHRNAASFTALRGTLSRGSRRGSDEAFGGGDELVHFYGLGEIFADAEGLGEHFMTGAGVSGDHDDVGRSVAGLARFYFFQHQKTASAGEHHVEDDDVRRVFLRQFHGLIAVACGFQEGAGGFESRLHAGQDIAVVIDEQDAFSFEGGCHGVIS
jgi:hypothetical protein